MKNFDETYLELAKAMDVSPLRGEALNEAYKMLDPILNKWNIKVVRKGNRFYVIENEREYEVHLVAE